MTCGGAVCHGRDLPCQGAQMGGCCSHDVRRDVHVKIDVGKHLIDVGDKAGDMCGRSWHQRWRGNLLSVPLMTAMK